ncbi:hypothetical protein K1719_020048 [Acacia pycnantha]|nr:hypothetical protein K1719_020048 [Acacia pycnantha]
MGIISRNPTNRKPRESMRLIVTTFIGVIFGFFIGVSFPKLSITKLTLPYSLLPSIDLTYIEDKYTGSNTWSFMKGSNRSSSQDQSLIDSSKIWVPSNPRGAEMLPPGIVEAESDFYLRRLNCFTKMRGINVMAEVDDRGGDDNTGDDDDQTAAI